MCDSELFLKRKKKKKKKEKKRNFWGGGHHYILLENPFSTFINSNLMESDRMERLLHLHIVPAATGYPGTHDIGMIGILAGTELVYMPLNHHI